MIRRLFRMGLWLGLLAGIVFALRRLLAPPPEPELAPKFGADQWRPLPAPSPSEVSEPLAEAIVAAPPAVEPMDEEEAAPEPESVPAPERASERIAPTWVDPEGKLCPESHPIKGNAQSKIFHIPGGLSYERTIPERCYESPEAAEADGFRQAKR